jgi:hypothetical protein
VSFEKKNRNSISKKSSLCAYAMHMQPEVKSQSITKIRGMSEIKMRNRGMREIFFKKGGTREIFPSY